MCLCYVRYWPLCAHQGRSDKRRRFSRAVVHGGSGKWLGWVGSGRSACGLIAGQDIHGSIAPVHPV